MIKSIILKRKFLMLLFIGVMLTLSMNTMQTSSAASNVYVNTTGSDTNAGTSADPYQTIANGVNQVDNQGTVHLSKGTFNNNNGAGHSDYGITISKNVTIQGAGSNETVIDAKSLNNIFTISNNANVIIRDLTIKNGKALSGGAITVGSGSKLTLINCIITNNIATNYGGAIYNSGNLNITSCSFASNSVTNGNGSVIYNHNGVSEIHFNTIIGNTLNAIYSDGGTVNAQNNWWGSNNPGFDSNSNPETELENFEDTNNWTAISDTTTISVNTVNGDKGIKVRGTNGSYPGIVKQVNYNFGGVAPKLQVWLYLDEGDTGFQLPTQIIDIGINLFSSTTDKYFETFLLQSQLHKGLNYIVIPTSNFESYGGMTWSDTITAMQFHIFYNPGLSTNVTFLEVKKNIEGIPNMIITFDDGYESIFTNALPIMQQYGIKGTIYVNTAYVGQPGRLTLAQLHILHDQYGWTIANHTPLHTNLITGSITGLEPTGVILSVNEIKAIVKEGMDWLVANGFGDGADHFALPWGQYNDNVLQALKELGVKTDRTVMLRMTALPADDLLQITQLGPNGGEPGVTPDYTSAELMNKFIDDTIESKTSTFDMFHEIVDNPVEGREWATSDFKTWIEHIVQTGIATKTVTEWYNSIAGLTYSNVNYSPWIVLGGSTSTNPVQVSATSTITADFTHNSNGEDISQQGHIIDGTPVNFVSDTLGTVNPSSSKTLNGKATTTFTAGTNAGTSKVNVTANDQTVSINQNIAGPSVPITIVNVDPANGSQNVPGNKVITITFNVPIKAGSAFSSIKMMNTNENADKPIVASISGNVLTITPTYNWLQFVTYKLTVPVNSITDLSGNTLASAFTMSFKCNNVADTTAPTVSSTDPVNNAINVAINKAITITFSEPIQAGNTYNNIKVVNTSTNQAQTITKTINGNILTITSPTTWLNAIKYTITIPTNSIKDLTGNNLTTDYTTNFTTITTTDTTPPTITSTDPVNNATNVPNNKVMTITFSEPIMAGSAYSSIVMMNTNENADKPIVTSISGNVLTIKATYNWLKYVKYQLTIPANSITDLAGNNLAANYVTSFKI
jgi:peptidoglycan/xylan/chitin deacetylase (PgdA/CDA1 family)/methionine-rich copper-binding protein CopC